MVENTLFRGTADIYYVSGIGDLLSTYPCTLYSLADNTSAISSSSRSVTLNGITMSIRTTSYNQLSFNRNVKSISCIRDGDRLTNISANTWIGTDSKWNYGSIVEFA